jgi:uncharacterized protein YjbI with pentapeptide repeats
MARVTRATILGWAQRWVGRELVPGDPSPFGMTETGKQDYRGVSFTRRTITNLEVNNADFSGADLRNLRIESCTFGNCIFERATLVEWVTRASKFDECRFNKADLRQAQIGYGGTDFCKCTFDGVRTTRAGFHNAVFVGVDFNGNDWSHTDFSASGFWDCSFRGTLNDIIFRGGYLFPYQLEISGEPRRTGLHNIDFTNADLHWVGAYNGCKLERIILPADGSAFICEAKDLMLLSAKFDLGSKEHEALFIYLKIIRPDPSTQVQKIISKNDLERVGGSEIGSTLYTILKSKLA